MALPEVVLLEALSDSPYAEELRQRPQRRHFAPKLEAEYVRRRLAENCGLIRATCLLVAAIAAYRWFPGLGHGSGMIQDAISWAVILASVFLCAVAFSPLFQSTYPSVARVIVPLRNALGAVSIAQLAAHGEAEALMVLPLMVIGPLFLLGLSFSAGLVAVAAGVASFAVAAAAAPLSGPVAVHAGLFLLVSVTLSVIAADERDKRSRRAFLESALVAELARHDALTGTHNRRVFDERLARLWQRAIREHARLAILLIDVDHFKAYNDRYGHQAGDRALRAIAETLQGFVRRATDLLARYGGEEFGVILYDVDTSQVEEIARRMCRTVASLAIEDAAGLESRVTISVGAAVIEPAADRAPRGGLQLADQALYSAKVNGRNRVELMDDSEYRLLSTGVFDRAAGE